MSPAGFLSDVLARVESTESTYSLAFESAEGKPLGELLVAEGEICLVTPSIGSVPLGVRLKQKFPEAASAVQEALVRVRTEGRPLGEVLSELGTVRSDQIRAALFDQISDGLCTIARSAPSGICETCLSVSRRRIPTILSAFSPADFYWRAMPVLMEAGEDPVARCFDDIAADAEFAILIAHGEPLGGEVIPIAQRGIASLSIHEGLRIGRAVYHMACAPERVVAGLVPGLSLLRTASDVVLMATSVRRTALFGGLGPAAQSRALSAFRGLWHKGD